MSFRKYRNGQPWTETDMKNLYLYNTEGKSVKEISSLLYRKKGSILTRMKHKKYIEFSQQNNTTPIKERVVESFGAPVRKTCVDDQLESNEYTHDPLIVRKLNFDTQHDTTTPIKERVVEPFGAPVKETRVVEESDTTKKNPLVSRTLDFDEKQPENKKYVCVFDTETTGLPPYAPVTDSNAWSGTRLVQFAYELYTQEGDLVEQKCFIIKPDGFTIPDASIVFHKITTEYAMTHGITIHEFFTMLSELLNDDITLVAHNMIFDDNVIQSELHRYYQTNLILRWKSFDKECTMMMGKRYYGKLLKLSVLYQMCGFILDKSKDLHQADVDTELCAYIYFHLRSLSISNIRYNLVSSYNDKEVLKYLGAKWDGGQRVWYIYDSEPFSEYVRKWFS